MMGTMKFVIKGSQSELAILKIYLSIFCSG